MDGKLLARGGAAVFGGFAFAMALVQLREQPVEIGQDSGGVKLHGADPLQEQLKACQQMGEEALSAAQCRAAWAENRRRFLGVDYPHAYTDLKDPMLRSAADSLIAPVTGDQAEEE